MFSRFTRMTFLAAAASLLLSGPLAVARDAVDKYAGQPSCAELENSALRAPEWYAERCEGGAVPAALAPPSDAEFVPGDTVFLCTLFSPAATGLNRRLLTAPLPTSTYTNVGVCSAAPLSIFAMDFDNPANVLWAIDSGVCAAPPTGCNGTAYGTINQTTGVFTVVGNITGAPATANFASIRFDPTSSTVYIMAVVSPAVNVFSAQLMSLNLTTGVATAIGPPSTRLIIDMAISNTGVLFAHDIAADAIVTINKTTGAVTLVGATGINAQFAQGMDFDASDNTLYLFAITIPGNVGRIGSVNLTTGAFTQLSQNTEELEGAIDVPTVPAVSVAPFANSVDAASNGVFQPGETVAMAPTWRNNATAAVALTGALTVFNGPPGPTYTIDDGAADYGTIAPASNQSCGASCYSLTTTAPTRPATHWDSTVLETVNPSATTKTWTLHIGDSFTDVPATNGFYRFIETILHHNVTSGCTATTYCPSGSTTREAMAVFVLVASAPTGPPPPLCVAGSETFTDVPATSGFCRWIEELERRGVVTGCGATTYCPAAPANREQMAVFVLRTLDGTLNPPACVAGSETFTDVPASSGFCRWIEELERRGVVTGCGATTYCPTDPVTREQMSVFLAVTFGLTLYGL